LKYHCARIFGGNKVSNPTSKGEYGNFTLYDIRHNSACYWFNRYPTQKGLMYRFGWRKADKIEYYSNFLGVADEITDDDLILAQDKNKLYKLEAEVEKMKNNNKLMLNTIKKETALMMENMKKSSEQFMKEYMQKYRTKLEKSKTAMDVLDA